MAVPASGELSLNSIYNELDDDNYQEAVVKKIITTL